MEKIKKISAALLAMAIACGAMASCGGSDNSSSSSSEAETTTTTAAAEGEKDVEAESDDGAAAEESKADEAAAESEAEAEGDTADEGAAEGAIPDPNWKPVYDYAGYDAFLMFGDMQWLWGNWNHQGVVHKEDFDTADPAGYGYGIDADITGDGEYTVAITKDSILNNNGYVNPQVAVDEDTGAILGAEGTVVFCVDIVGLMNGDYVSGMDDNGEWQMDTEVKKNKLKEGDNHYDEGKIGDYKPSDLKVELVSIKADGKEVEFDPTKIKYGNIEDNNNRYRIEIYNSYGKTVEDPGIDPMALVFNESLEVTFTIEGLGEVKTFPEVAPFGDGAAATEEKAEDAAEEEAPAEEEKAEETAEEEKAAE